LPTSARVQRGVRVDTRKHTRHCLRPEPAMVHALLTALAAERDRAFRAFAREYRALLEERFTADRAPFDALCELARERDVFLGCNCPTRQNPDVARCHTVLALQFLSERYPDLRVELP
jgi:hypothetical protein